MVGSLGNLYQSFEALDESYIQPNITKDILLKPPAPFPGGYSTPLLSLKEAPEASTEKIFYSYPVQVNQVIHSSSMFGHNPSHSGCNFVSDDPRAICPDVRQKQDQNYSSGGGGGFVKEVVTYMVMDDLVVQPMSTISSITLLNKFNINNVSALEEKVVDLELVFM
ncbi:hypothetical protein ACS0TY_005003 [Phlomoides rotata]